MSAGWFVIIAATSYVLVRKHRAFLRAWFMKKLPCLKWCCGPRGRGKGGVTFGTPPGGLPAQLDFATPLGAPSSGFGRARGAGGGRNQHLSPAESLRRLRSEIRRLNRDAVTNSNKKNKQWR